MPSWDPRALAVLARLERAGHQAVLVGGCVRDALLGAAPHDYDVATSARPEETMAACGDLSCVPTGLKHGTVTVLLQDLPVEVTTFRREGRYSDHRRPDQVCFTPKLEEDLRRRDFTINAMAWGPAGLVDPFGGQEDLSRRLIRCVGQPNIRFEEDALRILRGLRLSAQLGFSIEEETARAIHHSTPLLGYVAQERITEEFLRLLCGVDVERVLLEYSDVVAQILPELCPAIGFDPHSRHAFDLYTHSVRAAAAVPPTPVLRLAALLHDVGKPACFSLDETGEGHFYGHETEGARQTHALLTRMRVDGGTREQVTRLVERHTLRIPPTERAIRRWLHRLGTHDFLQLLELERGDALARGVGEPDPLWRQLRDMTQAVLSQKPCLTRGELAVNGRDALAAGLRGRAIGQALDRLLEQVALGELPNERAVLLPLLCPPPVHFDPPMSVDMCPIRKISSSEKT